MTGRRVVLPCLILRARQSDQCTVVSAAPGRPFDIAAKTRRNFRKRCARIGNIRRGLLLQKDADSIPRLFDKPICSGKAPTSITPIKEGAAGGISDVRSKRHLPLGGRLFLHPSPRNADVCQRAFLASEEDQTQYTTTGNRCQRRRSRNYFPAFLIASRTEVTPYFSL